MYCIHAVHYIYSVIYYASCCVLLYLRVSIWCPYYYRWIPNSDLTVGTVDPFWRGVRILLHIPDPINTWMRKYYIPCIYMYTYCPLGNTVLHINTSGVLLLLRGIY